MLGSHGPAGRICITALPGVEAPGVEAPNGNGSGLAGGGGLSLADSDGSVNERFG